MKIKEQIYTEAELAKKLNVHRVTLYRLRKARRIEFYRIGLSVFYGESHILRFLTRAQRLELGYCGPVWKGFTMRQIRAAAIVALMYMGRLDVAREIRKKYIIFPLESVALRSPYQVH